MREPHPVTATAASSSLERPSWIPPRAHLVITGRNDDSAWGEAWLGERRLAQLSWTPDGQVVSARQLDADGNGDGLEIQRDESGRVIWCAQWVRGEMHGPAIQFDEHGDPVLVTYFVRGRGTDIWMQCGNVTEVRELAHGQLHGLVRWGDPQRPWEEERYYRGQRHGIFREWDADGKLRDGSPRFYLHDTQVSRREYDAARDRDASLPRYDPQEDSNERTVPTAVRRALARARQLRRELALVEQVRRLGGG